MTGTEPNTFILILAVILIIPASLFLAYLLVRFALRPLLGAMFGRTPVYIASRYLFSRKNRNAINVITFIAVFGITVVTAALILVLSVFNGFQSLIEGMFTTFDPDIRIEAARGKNFQESDSLKLSLIKLDEVEYVAPVVEDKAMLTYYDKQRMVVLKGVPQDYLQVNRVDTLVYDGTYSFFTPESGFPMAVLGGSVAYYLNARISDRIHPMKLWAASESGKFLSDPTSAVRTAEIFTAGYFKVQIEYDSRYVLADFKLVQDLFDLHGKVSAYEVKVRDFSQTEAVRALIQEKLGDRYKVMTWYEQHKSLFDVMRNEKLVAYLILTLMLLISGVNIVGSLSMIIVEKTRDIAILKSMGASNRMIRRVFLTEGIFVGATGGFAGLISAFLIGFLHIQYGLLPINGGQSFSNIKYFPLQLWFRDFLLIFLTVFALSALTGFYPARRASLTRIVTALRK